MTAPKPLRRMTLRQLMTHAEKCTRDLAELIQSTLLPRTNDCRDLSRPIRRRSHYPTFVALNNALNKVQQGHGEIEGMMTFLLEAMKEIRDQAARERINRG